MPLAEEIKGLEHEHGLRFRGKPGLPFSALSEGPLRFLHDLMRGATPGPVEATAQQWFDWVDLVRDHGTLPLVWSKLNGLPAPSLPPAPVLRLMARDYLAAELRARSARDQLQELATAFSRAGIEMLVLKGAAFAHSLYPEPRLRPANDLDLLVRPADVPASQALLRQLRYTNESCQFERRGDLAFEDTFFRPGHENAFPVDLHWAMSPFPWLLRDAKLEELFRSAVPIKTAGLEIKTLGPHEAILYACIHLTWNHYLHLKMIWLNDLHLLAQRLSSPEDWERLRETTERRGVTPAVQIAYQLTRFWTGPELAPALDGPGSWPAPSPADRETWRCIRTRHNNPRSSFKIYCSSGQGLRSLLSVILRLVFPPPSLIKKSYPPPHPLLLPWSYLRRWGRWIKLAGKRRTWTKT